jgi:hypothetical protein
MMMKEEYKLRFERIIGEAADRWNSQAGRLACIGLYPECFVWFRPTCGESYGEIYTVPKGGQVDPIWLRASTERIAMSATRPYVYMRIREIAQSLPLIPAGVKWDKDPLESQVITGALLDRGLCPRCANPLMRVRGTPRDVVGCDGKDPNALHAPETWKKEI